MNRDYDLIRHILRYCKSIKDSIARFGDDVMVFKKDVDYRNSVCMSILQIGELSNHLSQDYIQNNTGIPWKQIIGLRNICAHAYSTVDYEEIFDIAHNDIDELAGFCASQLQENSLMEDEDLEI